MAKILVTNTKKVAKPPSRHLDFCLRTFCKESWIDEVEHLAG